MDIHWFPGHMTKSLRMMREDVKLVDVIFYVVDARAPKSCINPAFDEIIASKPVIYIMNKVDLISDSDKNLWLSRLKSLGNDAIALIGTGSKSTAPLVSMARRLCADKIERMKMRGIKSAVRAMVIGVPNTGKSTIINNLCGRASAVTGNKAGVTRGKQWVRVSEYFEVLDTPGTLYPKLSDLVAARRLAFIGSIKDEVLDTNELALLLVDELNSIDPNLLKNKYNIDSNGDSSLIMSDIARSRGYLMKGNVPDIDRTSVAIIDDFRKGKIGKICLDV